MKRNPDDTAGTAGRDAATPRPRSRMPGNAIAAALAAALLLLAVSCAKTGGETRAGFSSEGLAKVDSALARYIAEEKIAGAVVLAYCDGLLGYERAVGWADRDSGRRMEARSIFRIASQTKAVTSVAAMMLVEEGKLGLDDPVAEYLPAFASTTVALESDTGRAIVPAEREITIRDLLRHTAGISYGKEERLAALYEAQGLGPAAGFGWYLADKDEAICETIGRLAKLPFAAQPGEAFVYGYGPDVVGCVIERVSGVSLEEFVRTRITGPLKMKDTHFFLPPGKASRLATVYTAGEDGRVRRAPEGAKGQGHFVGGPPRCFSGGAGLVSTAADYARFLQMLLNGGELDGVRILPKKAVEEMTADQAGDAYTVEGRGFGLGFEIVQDAGSRGSLPEGSYGWGGAYGSSYVVVPRDNVVIVALVQILPNSSDFRDVIPELIYQALDRGGEE